VCLLGEELGDEKVCRALVARDNGEYGCGLVIAPYSYLPADRAAHWRRINEVAPGFGLQAAKDYHVHMLGAVRGCDSYKV